MQSSTTSAPARLEMLIAIERSLDDQRLEEDLEHAKTVQALGPPFQRVLAVRRDDEAVELELERFVGTDGLALVVALEQVGRVLPLDVWLRLAHAWGEGLLTVPSGSELWRTPVEPSGCGLDVRGRLVLVTRTFNHALDRLLTPAPVHVAGFPRIPQTLSPEHLRGLPLVEASRVYTFAATLIALLQGRRLSVVDRPVFDHLSAVALGTVPWSPERHPECSSALAQVLRRAVSLAPADRHADVRTLLDDLKRVAGPVADDARVSSVWLGATLERAKQSLAELERDPDCLPEGWRDGGLAVLHDQLLERATPVHTLPAAVAMPASVATRAAEPARPPRLNLAAPRPTGWRRFWPF